jgi:hypothetical protein
MRLIDVQGLGYVRRTTRCLHSEVHRGESDGCYRCRAPRIAGTVVWVL